MSLHCSQEPAQLLFGSGRGARPLVPQNVCGLPHPGIDQLQRRPQAFRSLEACFQQSLQSLQFFGEPLFSATRSRLVAIAERRLCSLSPDASSGGRPSSVSVLRTASQ